MQVSQLHKPLKESNSYTECLLIVHKKIEIKRE